jgi:GntR family transcriptional regulator
MAGRGTSSVGFKLANVLRERVAAGKYKRRFPTENELIAEFGMSRYAVRSAMQRLEQDGQIHRHPGRGTKVLDAAPAQSNWVIRTVEDLIDRNLFERPVLLSAGVVPARAYPAVAKLFGVGARGRLFLIERVSRTAKQGGKQGPAFFSLNFLAAEVGLALPRKGIGREPLVVQIERHRKFRAHRVRQALAGSQASVQVAAHLGIEPGHPIVIAHRTYFGWDGDVIATAELHYRLEMFGQTIDLFRGNVA